VTFPGKVAVKLVAWVVVTALVRWTAANLYPALGLVGTRGAIVLGSNGGQRVGKAREVESVARVNGLGRTQRS